MRQGSSASSSETLSQGLHPVLQSALDSLDIELEEELIRYRRQRYRQVKQVGQKSTLSWRSNHPSPSKAGIYAVDLPRFNPSADGESSEQPSEDHRYHAAIAVAARPPQPPTNPASANPKPDPLPDLWMATGDAGATGSKPIAPGEIITTLPATPGSLESGSRSLDSGSLDQGIDTHRFGLVAIESNATSKEIIQSEFDPAPDDYLASSEELLRSIAEEPTELRAERESNLLDTLLTPLGVGSMVLLLLSSVTLGYVIMHPSSLDGLVSLGTTSGDTSPTSATSAAPSSAIPDSPNLAADEFVDINLGTLSTLPRNGSRSTDSSSTAASTRSAASSTAKPGGTTPSASSSSTAPSADSIANLPPAPVLSAPAPAADPAPVSEAPAPIDPPAYVPDSASDPAPQVATAVTSGASRSSSGKSSAASSSASSSEPSTSPSSVASVASSGAARSPGGSYYYVVTPYNGDPSLEAARTAVPDAYVRNFSAGASVQLGAFSDANKAEALIQQLEQRGISAELYQPH